MQMFSFVCYFVVISAANVILFFKKQNVPTNFFFLFLKNSLRMADMNVFSYLCCYRDISFVKQPK